MGKSIMHVIKDLAKGLAFLSLMQCSSDEPVVVFYHEDELLISAYLESQPDKYSTLLEVLEITGIKPILNAYGHYTFFAPDNEAFAGFISSYGFTSVHDFEVDFLKSLVKYHLIGKEIETNYLPNGVLQDTTYTGDNLVFTFGEGGLNTITVNGESQITERDIRVANGFVNRVDKVFEPVYLSCYEKLKSLAGYDLFTQALLATGLNDTLNQIYVGISQKINVKTQFTLLCESDAVFNAGGIHSLDDLIAKYSDSGDLSNPANGLHMFMAYHILPDVIYLNQLDSFNYATLAPNKLANVKLTGEFLLNWHTDSVDGVPTPISVKIIRENSNISAKNGVIHSLDKILEIYDPKPVYFTFDLASYQGIEIGQTYSSKELKDIPGISTENTGIWYRMSMLDEDSSYLETTSSEIGWTVEFDLPPIAQGRYNIILHWVSDGDRAEAVQTFWDGEIFGSEFSMRQAKRPPISPPEWIYDFRFSYILGTVILDETKPHKIKFFGLSEGLGEFDYLSFSPE
jgi:uncharacterized surface protein with fasciclin (FAS1) repeats